MGLTNLKVLIFYFKGLSIPLNLEEYI